MLNINQAGKASWRRWPLIFLGFREVHMCVLASQGSLGFRICLGVFWDQSLKISDQGMCALGETRSQCYGAFPV